MEKPVECPPPILFIMVTFAFIAFTSTAVVRELRTRACLHR